MAGEREINFGADATDAQYSISDDDANSRFILLEDLDGGTVLIERDETGSKIVAREPIDTGANNITTTGTVNAGSVVTDKLTHGALPISKSPYSNDVFDETAASSGSVTLGSPIQLRVAGDGSSRDESRIYNVSNFRINPAYKGKLVVDVSNVTLDNSNDSRIFVQFGDQPDTLASAGNNYLGAIIYGDGEVSAATSSGGTASASSDTSQNNGYINSLTSIEVSWNRSSATVITDDGSTQITVSDGGQYPTTEPLDLKVAAEDHGTSAANNSDYDVTNISLEAGL